MPSEKEINVLIVDDHIQTAVSISQLLEYQGFKTSQAYNGIDAVNKAKKEKPDLLLLDIKIPKMSGFEVAEELKGQKILFMTAYDDLEKKAHQFKGCLGVIKKPVDPEFLIDKIRKIFNIKEKREI